MGIFATSESFYGIMNEFDVVVDDEIKVIEE